MTTCPVCGFDGSLATVRAHIAVRGRVDEAHAAWLEERGIDLADDTQASVSQLTEVLSRPPE